MIASIPLLAAISACFSERIQESKVVPQYAVEQESNKSWAMAKSNPEAAFTTFHLDFNAFGLSKQSKSGCRHLLEHLLAYGEHGKLEFRLESEGGFLLLRTYRDDLDIQIDLPNSRWKDGFGFLNELVTSQAEWSPQNIEGEKQTIALEKGLLSDQRKASIAAWQGTFGDQGADPVGNLQDLGRVTLTNLSNLASTQLTADRAALSIVSSAPQAEMMDLERGFLSRLPVSPVDGEPNPRKIQITKKSLSYRGGGSARACVIAGMDSSSWYTTLAAALAIAGECKGAYVDIEPSVRQGVIVVGSESTGEVEKEIDSLDKNDTARLFIVGRHLLQQYLRLEWSGQAGQQIRTMLMSQGQETSLPFLLDRAKRMSLDDFATSLRMFSLENGWEIVGS